MGRGKNRHVAPLQPNGAPSFLGSRSWTLTDAHREYVDATVFGEQNKSYIVGYDTGTNIRFNHNDVPPVEAHEGVDFHPYSLSGEFQGRHFFVDDLDLIDDNPIDEVVRQVLDLEDGDELMSISYRDKDGQVKVRPWSGE